MIKRRKPMSSETKEKISKAHKKRITQEQRDRMRELQKLSLGLRDIPAREHLRNNLLIKQEWDGTLKSLIYRVKRHYKFRIWKAEIKKERGFCEFCKTTEKLHIHHRIDLDKIIKDNMAKIIDYDFNIPLLWDAKNGQVLCSKCHRKLHFEKKIKKSKKAQMINLLQSIIEWDKNKNILDKELKNNIILVLRD